MSLRDSRFLLNWRSAYIWQISKHGYHGIFVGIMVILKDERCINITKQLRGLNDPWHQPCNENPIDMCCTHLNHTSLRVNHLLLVNIWIPSLKGCGLELQKKNEPRVWLTKLLRSCNTGMCGSPVCGLQYEKTTKYTFYLPSSKPNK